MMKKALLPILFSLLCGTTFGQKGFGGVPKSFKSVENFTQKKIALVNLSKPNMSEVVAEDMNTTKQSYRVGINIPVNLNMEKDGNWNIIGNTRVWKLTIHVSDAQALGLYMEDYSIPAGGKLFAYNKNRKQVIGAFTNETPSLMAMEMIQGEEITLEYNQPLSVDELPVFNISEVVYFYRGVEDRIGVYREMDFIQPKADACQVNVACPEGDDHQDQINSVVHYTFSDGGSSFVCSASLIANATYDCTPYILTATHCGEKTSTSELNTNIWYFNYQNPNCAPGTTAPFAKPSFTAIGGIFRASSKNTWGITNGNQVYGTDFTLVELTASANLPANAFFAGWDISTNAATEGVGVHHPAGHDKKISTYNNDLTTGTYNGGLSGGHWRVQWSSTQSGHGVTEGGSSGSPIFNQNGHVVGILSGGSSFCNATNNPDLYGKLDVSWNPAGSSADGRLKDWLDPENTGVTSINGVKFPCSDYLSVENEKSEKLELYPNPTKGDFKLENLADGNKLIRVSDISGRLIFQTSTDKKDITLSITNEQHGVYLITVISEFGAQTLRLVKK